MPEFQEVFGGVVSMRKPYYQDKYATIYQLTGVLNCDSILLNYYKEILCMIEKEVIDIEQDSRVKIFLNYNLGQNVDINKQKNILRNVKDLHQSIMDGKMIILSSRVGEQGHYETFL